MSGLMVTVVAAYNGEHNLLITGSKEELVTLCNMVNVAHGEGFGSDETAHVFCETESKLFEIVGKCSECGEYKLAGCYYECPIRREAEADDDGQQG